MTYWIREGSLLGFDDLSDELQSKDKYHYCLNCNIIKVIRYNGTIDYLYAVKDDFPKKLKDKPPCLRVITND